MVLGAKEVVWSAVPHAQTGQGGGGQKNDCCIRVHCGGSLTWKRAVSVACGVKSAWNWLKRESGEKLEPFIEYGQLFRVFSRRKMG